jgi:hypothetical protein
MEPSRPRGDGNRDRGARGVQSSVRPFALAGEGAHSGLDAGALEEFNGVNAEQ